MPRPRRRQLALRVLRAFAVFHRQRFFPILPVAILDPHRDRRPDRLAMPHAGQNVRRILLYTLARSAPVAQLPPVHFPSRHKTQHLLLSLECTNETRILPDPLCRVKPRLLSLQNARSFSGAQILTLFQLYLCADYSLT